MRYWPSQPIKACAVDRAQTLEAVRNWTNNEAAQKVLDGDTDPWVLPIARHEQVTFQQPSTVVTVDEARAWARVARAVAISYEGSGGAGSAWRFAGAGGLIGIATAAALSLGPDVINLATAVVSFCIAFALVAVAIIESSLITRGPLRKQFVEAPLWRERARAYEERAQELAATSGTTLPPARPSTMPADERVPGHLVDLLLRIERPRLMRRG